MKPLIGIPTNTQPGSLGLPELWLPAKYPRALLEAADCLPVLIPAWEWEDNLGTLLDRLDGVMLTGAKANVHPEHYDSTDVERAAPFDRDRDAVTLSCVTECIDRGLPLFAICRGLQEMNVALGGSLHPKLHDVDSHFDHRMPDSKDMAVRYGDRHPIDLVAGGTFEGLLGATRVMVNSLHGQGIDRLAPSLIAEGHAEDGTVEAIRAADATGFALGVQWHPEYRATENPVSRALFNAFGDSARTFMQDRSGR